MIRATNLNKIFEVREKRSIYSLKIKRRIEAVKDISVNVEKGKIVGLLGVNGAGKTTTIKMLATLLTPTSGEIEYDGIDAIKYPAKIKQSINMITGSERNLFWRLTGKENLEYFGGLYGIEKNILRKRIRMLLEMVELSDSQNIEVEKYSKGMKQRLQIAKGLINNPEYLFLDEPTLGLDIIIAKDMRNYIKKLALIEKKGVLLTTHYISEAEELCDYVYVIHKGKIVKQGTPLMLKNNFQTQYKGEFEVEELNDNLINEIKNITSKDMNIHINTTNNTLIVTTEGNDITEFILHLIYSCNGAVKKIQLYEPTLEDAVYSILGKEYSDD